MCNTEGFWILTRDIASELLHGELHLERMAKDRSCWSHHTHVVKELPVSSVSHHRSLKQQP